MSEFSAQEKRKGFQEGMRDGIPIALGYFAVAFSLGITARKIGLSPFQGFLSSFLNHASAGEYAELTVIAANASYFEMALIILVINARYLLMSFSLSQRFSSSTGTLHRILVGFGITDEIFGASIARKGALNPYYHYGAMILAIPLWSLGTAVGIIAGTILPARIVSALGVALYGMFLAIIVPAAKENNVITLCIIVSFLCSYLMSTMSVFSSVSESTRTIILTVLISAAAAVLFPHEEESE